ncbi:MAG: transporter, permease protein [Chitinophagaceae bacterium]|nr:transporter, permease protein [Chitinophagaceae bacterium]
MKLALFIAQRITFNRQKSFSRFIIRLATAATALSVASMIITMAFVNGFQKAVSEKVFSFWGHIRVQQYEPTKSLVAEETPLQQNDTVFNIVKHIGGVKNIQAFATKSAVIDHDRNIEGILFKGVEKQYDSSNIIKFLQQGRWLNFADTSYSKELLVSEPIAQQLNIKPGDTISIFFISATQGQTSLRKLTVAGIFKTGIEEYDKLFAIGDIRLLRRINNWEHNEIGGYEVFLTDYHQTDTINHRLYDELPQAWVSRSVKEVYPNIFDWLSIQDVNKDVIFIVMSVVAIINLITCLLILVLERTKMIGTLKAMGARDWTIQKVFLFNATYIAGIGIISGLFFGLGLCFLQSATGFIKLDETAYYVSRAPVYIVWWQVAAICTGTLGVCFLSLLLPTLLVRTIQPIKAIQFR